MLYILSLADTNGVIKKKNCRIYIVFSFCNQNLNYLTKSINLVLGNSLIWAIVMYRCGKMRAEWKWVMYTKTKLNIPSRLLLCTDVNDEQWTITTKYCFIYHSHYIKVISASPYRSNIVLVNKLTSTNQFRVTEPEFL